MIYISSDFTIGYKPSGDGWWSSFGTYGHLNKEGDLVRSGSSAYPGGNLKGLKNQVQKEIIDNRQPQWDSPPVELFLKSGKELPWKPKGF